MKAEGCRAILSLVAGCMVLAVLGLLLRVGFAAEGDLCEPSYSFYPVRGATAEAIKASMLRDGPKDDAGKSRFAITHWDVQWRWKRDKSGNVDLSTLQVSCKAVISFPKLELDDRTSPDVVDMWDRFEERLRLHELQHVSHVQSLVPEISTRLSREQERAKRLPVARANEVVRSLISEIRQKDRDYDLETNHGKTEGAWSVGD